MYSKYHSSQKLRPKARAMIIAVMMPTPSPPTQWITDPVVRRKPFARAYSLCRRCFSSASSMSPMPGARAVNQ
ncbi:hypothetical protein B0I33_104552 [Prauserella shujinwangii]|uniref:Uncharacterized protein n=1 Tax=Prauserella shujinwangii TaxID=1453103 RepID=A0A2T0LXI2_9PSEU|nr:hypothetical protein [Prauserella shujinwangii]PRX48734.1 hypothetical protein B0I33_104552 [Prauserella shujinwangii]